MNEEIISFGAGVNSVAMTILLLKRGDKMPIVFADTGGEHPETYCYIKYFKEKFLSRYGIKITVLSPSLTPEFYRKSTRYLSLMHYCFREKIIPFYKFRFCTERWKIEPIKNYRKGAMEFIGFAYDERHRAERARKKAIYPLIEERITRQGCIEIIKNAGLEVPRKSGCYFCPFQKISEWERLYKNHPSLYKNAEWMETNARLSPKAKKRDLTLRPSGPSLLALRERFNGKGGELFPDCNFEELMPCACMT